MCMSGHVGLRIDSALVFFVKQKTSYDVRINDWSSDVCSSDLQPRDMFGLAAVAEHFGPDYVVGTIEHCGRARCETALAVINKTNPAYVEGIIGQLMLREKKIGRAHV